MTVHPYPTYTASTHIPRAREVYGFSAERERERQPRAFARDLAPADCFANKFEMVARDGASERERARDIANGPSPGAIFSPGLCMYIYARVRESDSGRPALAPPSYTHTPIGTLQPLLLLLHTPAVNNPLNKLSSSRPRWLARTCECVGVRAHLARASSLYLCSDNIPKLTKTGLPIVQGRASSSAR